MLKKSGEYPLENGIVFNNLSIFDEDNWLALNQKYNKRQMIELVMLVGHYVMVAGLLINAGIELETATEKTLQGFYARLPKG